MHAADSTVLSPYLVATAARWVIGVSRRASRLAAHDPARSKPPGFALVVTLSLMVLLTLVAVGLLSLATITLRSASREEAISIAQANARMALLIALGELQKHAGPDQRVTGSGSLAGNEVQNPHWTGVWSTVGDKKLPVWLVSGNEAGSPGNLDQFETYPGSYFTPQGEVGQNPIVLHSDTDRGKEVRVPSVPVKSGGSLTSRYAWWISDEGAKARVDISAPKAKPASNGDRLARALVAQENRISALDPLLEPFSPLAPDPKDKRKIITHDTLGLSAGDAKLSRKFFHDLTTGGYGLPVNVAEGGMKADLSIAFDSSQKDSGYAAGIMGASHSERRIKDAVVHHFDTVRSPDRFFLIPELSENGTLPVGPNWGIVYNYCQLWKNVRLGQIPFVEMNPQPRGDLRTNNWPPYRNLDTGVWKNDRQHTNSTVTPVISMLQIGFRLAAQKIVQQRGDDLYQLQLQMKPVIGIWNPYNIRLQTASYTIDWALYPYLRIGVQTPDQRQYHPRSWMRENWLYRSDEQGKLSRWLRLETPPVDLEPGEIRLFSVGRSTDLAGVNRLVPTWNEEGAFTFDLKHSSGEAGMPKGSLVRVPEGSQVWYEDLFLEDSQHPETLTRFGSTYVDGVSASWLTLKTGGDATLNRTSDLWQTPTTTGREDLPYLIPEPVRAGEPGSNSASPRVRVESILDDPNNPGANGSPLHIGTWRWFSRNATDADDAQKLRGWADANPRFASANPLWEGSRPAATDGYEGWFFLSSFTGGSHENVYDGGPPGRGKVAEGQNEVPASPEATLEEGRYRGYGGFSNSSSGMTHVPLFDVPRGPLVSLGQLQHAQLSRYGYEPGFPFGNSYANPRIPLDQTKVRDFMKIGKFTMLDISHALNEALWDNYFFSTIGRDYIAPDSTMTLDSLLNFAQVTSGERTLPNPRHTFHPQAGDSNFERLLREAGKDAPRALAARIGIEGAFNVNSTSVEAWKAVLSSMADFEFPVVSPDGSSVSWATPKGIRFPKFGHVLAPAGWKTGDGPLTRDFWQGYRKIADDELDSLAKEIVKEVRLRGPFRSFADFVNRNPDATDPGQQRKGALQAALDRALNAGLDGKIGGTVTARPKGPQFSDAFGGESEAAGFAGHLMQGDVLQSLAPVMQVRSDSFRIRAMGQCLDAGGRLIARATCEALVQRMADFVDPSDKPEAQPAALSDINKHFGRRFAILSFRWLAQEEL
jgi:hypothetical protein